MNQKNKNKKCLVSDCLEKSICKGYCSKHYQQIRLTGKILEKNYMYINGLCKNIGCGKNIFAKGFCQTCYLKDKKQNARTNS